MTTLSILLIENNVNHAALVSELMTQALSRFRFMILRDLQEALSVTVLPDVVLVDANYFSNEATINTFVQAFPQAYLVALNAEADEVQQKLLMYALSQGLDDYADLTSLSLTALGQRLLRYQSNLLSMNQRFDAILMDENSDLAILGFNPDNQVHTWNQAAEQIFGLAQGQALNVDLDVLPISPVDQLRIKELISQARLTRQPFCISDYPISTGFDQQRWVRIYVYPSPQPNDNVYLLTTDISDLKGMELQAQRYTEELQVLLEVSRQVSEQQDLSATLHIIIEEVKSLLNADNCQVYFSDNEYDQSLMYSLGPNPEEFRSILANNPYQDLHKLLYEGQGAMLNFAGTLDDQQAEDPVDVHLLCAPLTISKKPVGLMVARRSDKFPFTRGDLNFFESLVHHASAAINKARTFEETQRSLEELSVLYEASIAVSTNWNSQEVLNNLVGKMAEAINATKAFVVSWDKTAETGQIESVYGELADNSTTSLGFELHETIPLEGRSVLTTALEQQRATRFDIKNPSLDPQEKAALEALNCTARLLLPLVIKGETIGWADLLSNGANQPVTVDDMRLARMLSNQAAVALGNIQYWQEVQQAYEGERRRREQAETLRDISAVVSSSLDLDEVLEDILDQLRRVIPYNSAAIHLIEGGRRRIIAGHGFENPDRVIGLSFDLNPDYREPGAIAIETQQPVIIGNTSEYEGAFKDPPHHRIKSWMGIPLIARDNTIGLITIDRDETDAFTLEERDLAQAFANQVAIAIENARLYDLEVSEIERELAIAHEIQETLLPQIAPQVSDLQIAGRITPVRKIGGDFFNFLSTDDEEFRLAIGDVSGKGIPAALYMAAAMTAMDAEIKENNPAPGELLRSLHEILYERLQQNRMNIGMQVASFSSPPQLSDDVEPTGKLLTIANAGMIAPIVVSPYGVDYLFASGLPLGAPVNDPVYMEQKILLDPGTAVIFTSDGIVEAQNERGELFSFERLEEAARECVHLNDAEQIAEHVLYAAQTFVGDDTEQHDDMTVVVVVVK